VLGPKAPPFSQTFGSWVSKTIGSWVSKPLVHEYQNLWFMSIKTFGSWVSKTFGSWVNIYYSILVA
jgi:hypothetical protein